MFREFFCSRSPYRCACAWFGCVAVVVASAVSAMIQLWLNSWYNSFYSLAQHAGMAKCAFTPDHKLAAVHLRFDALAFMNVLRDLASAPAPPPS